MRRLTFTSALLLMTLAACSGTSGSEGAAGTAGAGGTGPVPSAAGAGEPGPAGEVVVDASKTHEVQAFALGLNYWGWGPSAGSTLADTAPRMASLLPRLLRVGGRALDSSTPDPFTHAELDAAVTYAQQLGAEPLLQVPLLEDGTGQAASPQTAADWVTYANVTRGYQIRYWSIGHEPDLYVDQGDEPPSWGPTEYCDAVRAFTSAMRAVDPSIVFVGPELSWRYTTGSNDWLSPILDDCGEEFDVISVHRYPLDPGRAKAENVYDDGEDFAKVLESLADKLSAAGMGDTPLALTETNLTWDGDPSRSTQTASPGTFPAGLWLADAYGISLDHELWSFMPRSIQEASTLGLLASDGTPRPAYHALKLFQEHYGALRLSGSDAPDGFSVYASRTKEDDETRVIVINRNVTRNELTFHVDGLDTSPDDFTWEMPQQSIAAVHLPDSGEASVWLYTSSDWVAGEDAHQVP